MARNFDGVNDDLDAGNPAVLQITGDQITVAAWVRIASKTAEKKTVAKWADSPTEVHSYLLTVGAAGNDKALFAINSGGVAIATGTTALDIGTWYLIVGTYDGINIRIYVNGVQDGVTAKTGSITSTSVSVRIGMGSGTSIEEPFDGDIAHVSIRNVALDAGEVETLAGGPNPGNFSAAVSPLRLPRGLVSYPPLNGQNPEADIVGDFNWAVSGTTVVEEPPIPHSIVAPG